MAPDSTPPYEGPSIDDQRRFWDTWNVRARSPEQLNEWTRLRGAAILGMLERLALERPRIIDLGCGTGWLTEKLAAYGPVTGIDLGDECIEQARRRAPHIEYIAGDLFTTPLPQGHFDVVVSQDVVAHVVDPARYIALAAGLLQPGGHLIVSTTNRHVAERMDLSSQPPKHIARWLTMRSLRRLLRTHFTVVRAAIVMPTGTQGALRMVNSARLQSMQAPWISRARQVALKEKLVDDDLIALARLHSHIPLSH